MKKILALLLTALGLSSTFGRLYPEGLKNTACSQRSALPLCSAKNFESIDVQQFSELIADSNVVILDVRKASEYAEGHIKGAVLIDQFKSDFMEQAKAQLPKDRTIAVYCRSGRRSASACGRLADEGYKPINLKGGIMAWMKEGKPITKD